MHDRALLVGGCLHGTTAPSNGFLDAPLDLNCRDGSPVRYYRKTIVDPETHSANKVERLWFVYATEHDTTPVSEVVRMLDELGIPPHGEHVERPHESNGGAGG